MIRTLDHLTIYPDETGAPWLGLREVADLLKQPNTERVSRHIERGQRRTLTVGKDWRVRRTISLIDGAALVEACLALGSMPNADVRDFVKRSGRAAS
jgi:hypothetical protein